MTNAIILDPARSAEYPRRQSEKYVNQAENSSEGKGRATKNL